MWLCVCRVVWTNILALNMDTFPWTPMLITPFEICSIWNFTCVSIRNDFPHICFNNADIQNWKKDDFRNVSMLFFLTTPFGSNKLPIFQIIYFAFFHHFLEQQLKTFSVLLSILQTENKWQDYFITVEHPCGKFTHHIKCHF